LSRLVPGRRGDLFGYVGCGFRALAGQSSACWEVGSSGSPFWLVVLGVVGPVPIHVARSC